jgi:predicted permease
MAIMLAAAALLLLIACVNIAGMMMARSYDRRREVAVRLAMGAGRGRLVRQMLAESVLLAVIGGAGGVMLAAVGTASLSAIDFPFDVTVTLDVTPDRGVLLVTLALTVLTGVLFGLAPALSSSRTDLTTSLKEGAQGPGLGRRRGAFVVGQLAVSTLLLVTAGVFVRSLAAMTDVPLGFDPDGVLVASVAVESHGYGEEAGRLLYDRLLEGVRAIPGVESAGLGSFVLLRGSSAANDGRAADGGDDAPEVTIWYNVVEPGYFAANRVELVEGRFFTDADDEGAPRVAVVNQTLAERLWPEQPAVGRAFGSGGVEHRVVGVVRDGVYTFVNETPRAFSYYPFAQQYRAGMSLHVRSAGPLGPIGGEVGDIVRDLDPNIAVGTLITMDEIVSLSAFGPRFIAWLTTLFASLGLLLAVIGVYGLLAVHVARRGREFGVRMALGAKARDVLLLVLGRGVTATVLGCALGVALALGTGRLLGSLLHQVSPFDPLTFVLVPTVLLAAAIAASTIPARRAARVSPTAMLREE